MNTVTTSSASSCSSLQLSLSYHHFRLLYRLSGTSPCCYIQHYVPRLCALDLQRPSAFVQDPWLQRLLLPLPLNPPHTPDHYQPSPTRFTLWIPKDALAMTSNTDPIDQPPHHPLYQPLPQLMLAPCFITQGPQVLYSLLPTTAIPSANTWTINLQQHPPPPPTTLPPTALEALAHHRRELYLHEKIRLLLWPFKRKVFYAHHPNDLHVLPHLRQTFPHQPLWIHCSPAVSQLIKKVQEKPQHLHLRTHSYPKEPVIPLTEWCSQLYDPHHLTIYTGPRLPFSGPDASPAFSPAPATSCPMKTH